MEFRHSITKPAHNTRFVRNLRQWITHAGKHSVTSMTVTKTVTGGADVTTIFDDGTIFRDRWASFSVFEDYVLRRSRNFRGVSYTVWPYIPAQQPKES